MRGARGTTLAMVTDAFPPWKTGGALGMGVVLAGLTACTALAPIEDVPAPRIRYVALGDSVAAGTGSPTSYPEELTRLLRREGAARPRLRNLGQGGLRSEALLSDLRRSAQTRRAVASAELITVTVGANDLVAMHDRFRAGTCGENLACYRLEVDAFIDRWEAILDEILRLRRPGAVIRATNYYDPYTGNPEQQQEDFAGPYPEGAHAVTEAWNHSICSVAEDRGIPCADLHRVFNGPDGRRSALDRGLLADDGFHPSAEGHRLIARRIRALGLDVVER